VLEINIISLFPKKTCMGQAGPQEVGGVTASDDATLASEEAGNVKSRLLGPSHVKRTSKIPRYIWP